MFDRLRDMFSTPEERIERIKKSIVTHYDIVPIDIRNANYIGSGCSFCVYRMPDGRIAKLFTKQGEETYDTCFQLFNKAKSDGYAFREVTEIYQNHQYLHNVAPDFCPAVYEFVIFARSDETFCWGYIAEEVKGVILYEADVESMGDIKDAVRIKLERVRARCGDLHFANIMVTKHHDEISDKPTFKPYLVDFGYITIDKVV